MRLPRHVFIRLSALATAVWLARSAYEIIPSGATSTAKVKLTVIALMGAVVIMAFGFAVQWAVDYIRAPRRRRDDSPKWIDR
jgi:hypothetical protein